MNEQEFVSLLQTLLDGSNTEAIKQATERLKKDYYTSPDSLSALIHIITSHDQPELRQLAAVEARKLVSKQWMKISDEQRPALRQQLLQSTFDEEKSLPRNSKSRVIAELARVEFADGGWADLPSILQQAATNDQARHREVGLYIIYTLLETMPDMFQENMNQMLTLFNRTIQDPESIIVRVNTMLALSELAMVLDTEEDQKGLRAFQSTIPPMVKALQSTIEAQDEEHTMQAFDVFNKLLTYESAFLNQHFGDLLQFFMQVAAKTEIDDEVRSQAFSFLMQCVRYRKLKVQSLKVGEQMTKMALQVATELDILPDEEDDLSPARSALGLLDILSESLPPSQVAVPLLKAIGPYVQSDNPDNRRAGILALGMCVEGAPDFIATQLSEILPLVYHLLEDESIAVRSATLNGVARLADDLAEEMGKAHARLVPALVKNYDFALENMRTAQPSTKELELYTYILKGSCIAIDSLIEGLEQEDAARYVNELVPRFAVLFDHEDHKVQMAAISAVGSIASASEKAFEPYFSKTMQSLGQYIGIKDNNDQLELRSMVVDSLGKIASAVGPETFQPYVTPLMAASEEGLNLDHQRLKETSFMLWSILAKVYEENFEHFLQGVMKSLWECLEQEETDAEVMLGADAADLVGQEVTIAGRKIKVAGANGVSETDADGDDVVQALMDAEDDDDDDDNWDDLGAVTAVAMEKEIAIEVVGDVLSHTKSKFLPFAEKTLEIAIPLLDHTFEGVRKSAVSTLWRAYAMLWNLAEENGMAKWQPGLPVKAKPTVDLVKLGDLVMKGTLALWEEEMDRGTITEINRHVAATLKLCGPAILSPSQSESSTPLEQITALLLLLLQKQHPCQKDEDDLDGDEPLDDETAEYDWLVIETAMEVVAALSTALGEQFGELWKIFETTIMKYASSQERFERSSAVGTIADCVESMGAACTPYTSKLMRIFVKRLSDEDPESKSNAAFGTGLLCEKSTNAKDVLSNYGAILSKLEPLLDPSKSAPPSTGDAQARLLDNAAGCVSRMIKKSPQNVPLEDVLPRLVEILPLKEDYDENEPVYGMIVSLYQQGNSVIQSQTNQLLLVFEQVLGPPEEQLSEGMRGQITQLVEFLKR